LLDAKPAEHTCADRPNPGRHLQPLDPDAHVVPVTRGGDGGRVGVAPASPQIAAVRVAQVSDERTGADAQAGGVADEAPDEAPDEGPDEASADAADPIADAQAAIEEARRRVAEAPPEVVVTNHVMGLYELAAIHLSAEQPNLPAAALAIDAVACLVDGLGDRLGPDVGSLRDALANIRLAFVQIKARAQAQAENPAPDGG
jgi:hypothetical protein